MAFRYRFCLLLIVAAESPQGVLAVAGSLRPSDGWQSFTTMLSVEVSIGLRALWGKFRFGPTLHYLQCT
jgi:hypothetical protein